MRISVTALDSYSYYLESGMAAERYALRLKDAEPRGEAAALGIALHDRMEQMDLSWLNSNTDRLGRTVKLERPQITEMKIEEPVTANGEEITLVGKVDAVCGLKMVDYKFTSRIDHHRLYNSWQWRCYLWIMGARYRRFVYEVFRYRAWDSREELSMENFVINDHARFEMNPYPRMGVEILQHLGEYVRCLRGMERLGLITIGQTTHRGIGVLNLEEERACNES